MPIGLKTSLRPAAFAAVGATVAGLACLYVCYDTPGRLRVDSVKRKLGLGGFYDRFTAGIDNSEHNDEWPGVRSPTNPIWKVRRGFDVVKVAGGLTYPVNMAFRRDPANDPDSPIFYVNELHGAIKYLGRDGKVRTYADKLINFQPFPLMKSDEMGLSGLLLVPGSDDLIVTSSYDDKASGLTSNHILRLVSQPGGKALKEVKVLLDLKEFTSPSNQIQQVLAGPDGKLYVAVGDAESHRLSLDRSKFGGKILRLNLDGSACEDNPFYSEQAPDAPASYVWAFGVRNVFDMDFDPATGGLYAVDNGKNLDRFFKVVKGASYGWNGDPGSIRTNALFTWGPEGNTAPVGLTFLTKPVLGEGTVGRCYVAMYGPAAGVGANQAKSIVELVLDPKAEGMLARTPETLIQYTGVRKTTVLGLAQGPDGLYFTDFFGESEGTSAEGQGNVWKVVPSKETLDLPDVGEQELAKLPAEKRGQFFFSKNCSTCHLVEGVGGREGPELTHAAGNLNKRLNSKAYEVELGRMLTSDNAFLKQQHDRLEQVRAARGPQRLLTWVHHHLEEPRFDNLHAKMPSFAQALPEAKRQDITAYLMTRK